jgi:hypothetical protein
VGAGVAVMQYAAIGAMRLAAVRGYRSGPLLTSIVLDILISFVGLMLVFHSRDENRDWTAKLAITVVIGLAIPLVHYMSMSAVSFIPTGTAPDLRQSIEFTRLATAGMVIAAFLVLGSACACRASGSATVGAEAVAARRAQHAARADRQHAGLDVRKGPGEPIRVGQCVCGTHTRLGFAGGAAGKNGFRFLAARDCQRFFEDEQNVMRSGQPLHDHEEKAWTRKETRHTFWRPTCRCATTWAG